MSKYRYGTKKKTSNYLLFPLIAISAFLPMVVSLCTYQTHLNQYPWFPSLEKGTDIFLCCKSRLFLIICTIIAGIIVYSSTKKKALPKKTPIMFIPLAIYGILSLLSSIFSEYATYSFRGIHEQFESIWVLLGYCLVAYYSYLFINKEEDVRLIIKWLFIGVIIISIIGISQLIHWDFYKTPLGEALINPKGNGSLDFHFEPGRVYMSLYNPNYVGVYVALLAPVVISLILSSSHKKSYIKYSLGLFALLLCLFGSQSRAGILTLLGSSLFLLLLYRQKLKSHWKLLVCASSLTVLSFFLVNSLASNILLNRVLQVFSQETKEYSLSELQTNQDNVTLVYNQEKLWVQFDLDQKTNNISFHLWDKNKKQIELKSNSDGGEFYVDDPRFSDISLGIVDFKKYYGFFIRINEKKWYFTNQSDNTYLYCTSSGKLDTITPKNYNLFKGKDALASGRGYIWSRTIPLLKNNIFLGSGADSFTLVFPNDDYLGIYNAGYDGQLFTKPHSLFLQIGVQTGIVSLLAFLIFYGIYFISSIRIYWQRSLHHYLEKIGAGIFVGTMGYMISGLTNDSTIAVAPVFWTLIGMGIAINTMLNKKAKE